MLKPVGKACPAHRRHNAAASEIGVSPLPGTTAFREAKAAGIDVAQHIPAQKA